ncbi:MAG: hypothetical protein JWN01_1185 [Patescibacteria group bacterium]|nr:hypothetical protein [Patescibacteria group bacterium]
MAGYSPKSLIDKLGVKPGARVIVMRAPKGYLELLLELDDRANVSTRLVGRFDFIQYFATSEEQLSAVMPNLAQHLVPNGMLWVSWAKRTSSLHTGLDENVVRRLGLAAGLVDVKVAAVTDDWSGLKFVYRVADR